MTIVVAGSLNMDLSFEAEGIPESDDLETVSNPNWLPGGHAANCASTLAQLGESVRMLGAVGDDAFGNQLVDELEAIGIDVSFIEKVRDSSTGIVLIPRLRTRRFMWWARGANIHVQPASGKQALESASTVIVFDPPKAVAAATMAHAITRHIPTYWAPSSDYAGDEELLRLAIQATAIIVNAVEFRLIEATDSLHDVPLLIRTMGQYGAEVYTHGEFTFRISAPAVAEVDATGAGDTFVAGFVEAQRRGKSLKDSLLYGNELGSQAVQVLGARWSPQIDLGSNCHEV